MCDLNKKSSKRKLTGLLQCFERQELNCCNIFFLLLNIAYLVQNLVNGSLPCDNLSHHCFPIYQSIHFAFVKL